MLPTGHVAFTWGALNALQRAGVIDEEVDYRAVALSAITPDVIDKPLAVFIFPKSNAALLFSHTLVAQLLVWAVTVMAGKKWMPYALAFSGHLLLDRMWGFAQTLLWPFRGWRFHQWRHVGSPDAFVSAYKEILRKEPKLTIFELAGLLLMAWLMIDRKLYHWDRLRHFVATGRPPELGS